MVERVVQQTSIPVKTTSVFKKKPLFRKRIAQLTQKSNETYSSFFLKKETPQKIVELCLKCATLRSAQKSYKITMENAVTSENRTYFKAKLEDTQAQLIKLFKDIEKHFDISEPKIDVHLQSKESYEKFLTLNADIESLQHLLKTNTEFSLSQLELKLGDMSKVEGNDIDQEIKTQFEKVLRDQETIISNFNCRCRMLLLEINSSQHDELLGTKDDKILKVLLEKMIAQKLIPTFIEPVFGTVTLRENSNKGMHFFYRCDICRRRYEQYSKEYKAKGKVQKLGMNDTDPEARSQIISITFGGITEFANSAPSNSKYALFFMAEKHASHLNYDKGLSVLNNIRYNYHMQQTQPFYPQLFLEQEKDKAFQKRHQNNKNHKCPTSGNWYSFNDIISLTSTAPKVAFVLCAFQYLNGGSNRIDQMFSVLRREAIDLMDKKKLAKNIPSLLFIFDRFPLLWLPHTGIASENFWDRNLLASRMAQKFVNNKICFVIQNDGNQRTFYPINSGSLFSYYLSFLRPFLRTIAKGSEQILQAFVKYYLSESASLSAQLALINIEMGPKMFPDIILPSLLRTPKSMSSRENLTALDQSLQQSLLSFLQKQTLNKEQIMKFSQFLKIQSTKLQKSNPRYSKLLQHFLQRLGTNAQGLIDAANFSERLDTPNDKFIFQKISRLQADIMDTFQTCVSFIPFEDYFAMTHDQVSEIYKPEACKILYSKSNQVQYEATMVERQKQKRGNMPLIEPYLTQYRKQISEPQGLTDSMQALSQDSIWYKCFKNQPTEYAKIVKLLKKYELRLADAMMCHIQDDLQDIDQFVFRSRTDTEKTLQETWHLRAQYCILNFTNISYILNHRQHDEFIIGIKTEMFDLQKCLYLLAIVSYSLSYWLRCPGSEAIYLNEKFERLIQTISRKDLFEQFTSLDISVPMKFCIPHFQQYQIRKFEIKDETCFRVIKGVFPLRSSSTVLFKIPEFEYTEQYPLWFCASLGKQKTLDKDVYVESQELSFSNLSSLISNTFEQTHDNPFSADETMIYTQLYTNFNQVVDIRIFYSNIAMQRYFERFAGEDAKMEEEVKIEEEVNVFQSDMVKSIPADEEVDLQYEWIPRPKKMKEVEVDKEDPMQLSD